MKIKKWIISKGVDLLRLTFILYLFVNIVIWSFSSYSSTGMTGLLNDLITGLVLFAILIINCIAAILSFKNTHRELANKISLFSLAILLLVLFGPTLVKDLSLQLK